jgi:hypothetical protein
MESRFEYVSALEGLRQLVAEFSNAGRQRKSGSVLFYVHSGKRIRLLQQLYFRDQGQLLSPGEFAAKLLDLVAV